MRKSLEIFVGSVVVYAAMAACSGSGGAGAGRAAQESAAGQAVAMAGAPSEGGQSAYGGAPEAEAGQGILNPVAGARAQEGGAPGCGCPEPVPPVVLTADCSSLIKINGTNQPAAVFEFAGKSAQELQRATVSIQTTKNDIAAAEGYTGRVQQFFVRDGAIGVICAKADESVTVSL